MLICINQLSYEPEVLLGEPWVCIKHVCLCMLGANQSHDKMSAPKLANQQKIHGTEKKLERRIPKKRAEGFPGLDLNSGWNWTPT